MDSLNPQVFHEQSPLFPRLWPCVEREAAIFGEIEQGLLDKPADHSWVGPAAGNSCCFSIVFSDFMNEILPESIVAPLF